MSDLIERIRADKKHGMQHAFSPPYFELVDRILADAEALKAADAMENDVAGLKAYFASDDYIHDRLCAILTAYRKARGGE